MKTMNFRSKLPAFLLTILSVTNLVIAGQYSVDGLSKNTKENTYTFGQMSLQGPITTFYPDGWVNTGRNNQGITFLKDANDNKFVLKYYNKYSAKTNIIHEMLGSKITTSVNVPTDKITILSRNSLLLINKFPLNEIAAPIATLHNYIPGENLPYNLNIKQGIAKKKNLISITASKDLCDIVAANIYLNDADGKAENIRFNSETNKYYTIDKGIIFRHAILLVLNSNDKQLSPYNDGKLDYILPPDLLATKAHDYLENIKKDELSTQQIKALRRVNKKLGQLVDKYPAEKIYDEWMNIAKEVNYTYSPQKKECFQVMVQYNCHEVKRLRSLLTTLTE